MEGKRFGKSAKNVGDSEMSSTALIESKHYYDSLMDAVHKGRRDRNGSARGRLADGLRVKESRLVRLEYKYEEMKDVGGELYRRLRMAYEAICEGNEAAAEAMKAERLELRAYRNATDREPAAKGS